LERYSNLQTSSESSRCFYKHKIKTGKRTYIQQYYIERQKTIYEQFIYAPTRACINNRTDNLAHLNSFSGRKIMPIPMTITSQIRRFTAKLTRKKLQQYELHRVPKIQLTAQITVRQSTAPSNKKSSLKQRRQNRQRRHANFRLFNSRRLSPTTSASKKVHHDSSVSGTTASERVAAAGQATASRRGYNWITTRSRLDSDSIQTSFQLDFLTNKRIAIAYSVAKQYLTY